ncbi:uncharacterized protein LOC144635846 isoform X1 [Oculina patagonica]
MRGMKAFVLFLLLVFGSSISSGRYIEDASEREEDRDEAGTTEDEREMEDDEEEEEDPYGEEEREDNDEQERDPREEVVHIPGQSPEDRVQEDTEDEEEDDQNEDFEEDEREEDDLHDDRMMDGGEGGMSLAGQTEEDGPEETGFEGFKRKVEEINKANEDMQAEINKLKIEFDKALSSDSNNGVSDTSVESKSAIQPDTSEDTAGDLKRAGVQHRMYSEDDLVRQYSEIGEDANIAPDDDY